MAGAPLAADPALARALARRDALLGRIARLVAAPSVGGDPAQADGMESARRQIESYVAEMGFENLRRLSAPDDTGDDDGEAQGRAEAIYADWLHAPAGAPVLLVYGHYDVQPPEPLEDWQTPPFEMHERDGRVYGRGISDDKGPLLIALAAIEALLAEEGGLPVNIRLLIEGEEETGSPSMSGILARHRDLLAADAVLSADGARWRADLVSLNIGSRGNAGFEISLRTAGKDLHSGRYGGVVPNALHELARMIAALHDADGRIAAPGFYDGVAAPTPAEQAEIAAIPFDEDAFFAPLGSWPQGEHGRSTLERLWMRPTLDVNGMWGGHCGAGSKTVIPATAHAKLTMRLVPGQDPDAAQRAVIDHLRSLAPAGADLRVHGTRGASGANAVPVDHPLLAATTEALEQTTGQRPHLVRIGASIPLTQLVEEQLGLATVMFSFSTSDEDFHAPNEFLRSASIDEGLAAWIAALRAVGRQDRGLYAPFRRD